MKSSEEHLTDPPIEPSLGGLGRRPGGFTAGAPREGWSKKNDQVASAYGHASWQGWCDSVAETRGYNICGARAGSKRDPAGGKPCERDPGGERDRCRFHGGKSKRGPAHPAFVDGRSSRDYVPDRLRTDYEAALDDPDLISTRRQMALLDAREAELLRQLGGLEPRQAWNDVLVHFGAFEAAHAAGQEGRAEAALDRLREVISIGATDTQIWRELRSLSESRRKLADTERKRLEAMSQFVTSERVMATLSVLGALVAEHVSDPGARDAISEGLRGMIGAAGQR